METWSNGEGAVERFRRAGASRKVGMFDPWRNGWRWMIRNPTWSLTECRGQDLRQGDAVPGPTGSAQADIPDAERNGWVTTLSAGCQRDARARATSSTGIRPPKLHFQNRGDGVPLGRDGGDQVA